MANSSRGMSFRFVTLCAVVCVAALMLIVAPMTAWAQATSTGTVTGVVTDTTNAIVAGATVALTQTATGAVRTTTTDSEGRFVFAFVQPGSYSLKISKQGFASAVVSSQTVQIGTQLTENVKLQVGTVSTTVEVTEAPGAELQTMNATVGTTLSGAIITNLPNTTRDASTLAILEPGQNINGNTGGVASDQNSFQLDGGMATDDMSGDNNTYIRGFAGDTSGGTASYHSSGYAQAPSAVVPIPVSSIQEFKVSTANQTADFNGGAGSQMQLVTKRGTKTFHGTGYEYYLDNNFGGANTWDNNSTGTAQPGSHFSRFGAAAGGEIPHSNFLGGSWYLFGNYEGFRYPESSVFEESFPLPSMRAGILHLPDSDGVAHTINLNPFPVVDPGCGAAANCKLAAQGYSQVGQSIPTTMCPAGPCDPRGLGTTLDGTPGGTPNPVITLWNTYLPLPNDCTHGDGINYCGYKGSIATPQTSNFVVFRVDHDFAKNWHFNATYHYYKLTNTVSDQWDIGGIFPGDTAGQYSAIRQKPQVPWIYTAGLTTDVTPNLTNDFHFSFTRNYWAYLDPSGVPNIAGYPAALEIGGETSNPYGPYNTNNQSTRQRFWDGKDAQYRDDVTWIKGKHLLQLGGMYLRNNDTHDRNDNGQSINTYEQYLVGAGNGASLAGYGIDMTGYNPGVTSNKYGNLYSMVLGMVDETQSLYTRGLGSRVTGLPLDPRTSCAIAGVPQTSGCISSPSLLNDSIIPTYNLYFTDSWSMKPTFTLNYGLGYTVEMPPYELNGGVQTVMVDGNDQILYSQQYLNNEKQAALQGLAYAPLIGFSTVRNTQGHSKYPYDPFYGGFSPRIGFAWNVEPNTVVRGGFSRIYGRINGVNPILVPMLTPGLMQPATCGGPNISGGCGGTPSTVFRVGVDGTNAPLPAPSAHLPQPWFPGFNDVATGAGETIDPDFKPNVSNEFTISVQRQIRPKILAEVGYIGRILKNEIQYYSLTNVPYMMTQGGQTFASAWSNVMVATNYGTNLSNIPVQPFFESALGGPHTPYCTGFANCTTAFVTNNSASGSGLMLYSDPFDAWAGVSNAGAFTFGRSFTSDPIAATCTATVTIGCGGQSPSITTTISNGYGNYNGGYLQLTFSDWHGLTMKSNFSMSNALGTGDVVQASSSYSSVDPFNLHNNYGPQYYNEKFTFNFFINYASPFFADQKGVVGHLLGGWSFAPLFVAGSGFPVELTTANFNCGSLGECNTNYVGAYENDVITKNIHYSATEKVGVGSVCGYAGPGYNVFTNPDASCPQNGGIFGDPVRSPVLGLDGQIGGGGPITGLPFWNLDLGITRKIKINERFSSSLYFDFTNVLNHMQPADPCFTGYDTSTWGVLGCGGNLQANTPRRLQLGLSFDW
jgi:Carboxypeptidase regulatory-like domain